jgi:hypothetical protein
MANEHDWMKKVKIRPPAQSVNPYAATGGTSPITDLASLKTAVGAGQGVGIPQLVQSMPEFMSAQGTEGALRDPYRWDPTELSYATMGAGGAPTAFGKMSSMALGAGPTDMYRSNIAELENARNMNLEAVNRDVGNMYAQGASNIASAGGLDSGAMERLQRGAGAAGMGARANVYGADVGARLGAMTADTALKTQLLGQVTAADLDRARFNAQMGNQAGQFNAGAALGNLGMQNQYNMGTWGKLGDIVGAGKVADAMAPQGGSSNPLAFLGRLGSPPGGPGMPPQLPGGYNAVLDLANPMTMANMFQNAQEGQLPFRR